MKHQTTIKFEQFKENPLGCYKTTIDMLRTSEFRGARAYIPLLITIKRQLVLAYAQALHDNDLLDEEEFNKIDEEMQSDGGLLLELQSVKIG